MSATAAAQPVDVGAQSLFDNGQALMKARDFEAACDAFDASQRLEPTIVTLLNQGDCREQNGQLATAWGLFLEAVRQTRESTTDTAKRHHEVARKHAAALEPRLSKLAIHIASDDRTPGLVILRNTEEIDPAAWNHALPVDGGKYTITASAPGHDSWKSEVIAIAREGGIARIDIPRLAKTITRPLPPPEQVSPAPRRRWVPFAIGGGAVALLASAGLFELSSSSTYGASEREPDDARQESLWRSAVTKHYVAQGMLIGGLATAGVAVWMYLRRPSSSSTGIAVQPSIGAQQAGIQIFGRY